MTASSSTIDLRVFAPQAGVPLLTLDCRGHDETPPLGDPDALSYAAFADDVCAAGYVVAFVNRRSFQAEAWAT